MILIVMGVSFTGAKQSSTKLTHIAKKIDTWSITTKDIEDLQNYWDQKIKHADAVPIIGALKPSGKSLLDDVEALLRLEAHSVRIEAAYRDLNAQLAQEILRKQS